MVSHADISVGSKVKYRGDVWTVTDSRHPHTVVIGLDSWNNLLMSDSVIDGCYECICLVSSCPAFNGAEISIPPADENEA